MLIFGIISGCMCTDAILTAVQQEQAVVQLAQVRRGAVMLACCDIVFSFVQSSLCLWAHVVNVVTCELLSSFLPPPQAP